ncbi:hypothetical protein Bca101_022169 [Brassica carinata]
MGNPEKMKVNDDTDEKEREDSSDEQWSGDDEPAMRDIVLGLPALSISSETFAVSTAVDEEEEARLNEQAVVAAELVIAAAEEAVMKEKSDGKKKKVRRQRKTMKLNDDEAGGSSKGGGESTKKPRKKTSEFTNLPRGAPVCNVCGRAFGSWKAVFGHLRSHKDRNYRGFLPPPKFTAPTRGVMIPGPNSAFVRVVARGGSSGGVVATGGVVASGGGATGGEGGRGVGLDMNMDRVEEENQEVTESGTVAKFDLNKSPPKDEEEEDKTK